MKTKTVNLNGKNTNESDQNKGVSVRMSKEELEFMLGILETELENYEAIEDTTKNPFIKKISKLAESLKEKIENVNYSI